MSQNTSLTSLANEEKKILLDLNESELNEFDLNGVKTYAKVLRVYDGDTIWVGCKIFGKYHKLNIRLLGYNSPEIRVAKSNPKRDEIKKAGYEAKDYLSDLINDQIVWVEFKEYGKFGRALADVYSIDWEQEPPIKKIFVNKVMVEEGHGEEFYC